jgi:hypothetical protein
MSQSMPSSAVVRFDALGDGELRAAFGVDFSPGGTLTLADVARCQNYLLDEEALRRNAFKAGLSVAKPFVECVLEVVDAQSFDFIPIDAVEPSDVHSAHLDAS